MQLLATTDRIVLLNVPPVTIVPYLTLVPNVVVDTATLEPIPGPGGEPVPLLGPDGPLAPDDLVAFDAIERILEGDGIPVDMGGTGAPLPASVVLDAAEQAVARAAIAAYNQAIAQSAALHGLPVVDVHAILTDIDENGLVVGDETLTTEYLVGGLFSLDGVHPDVQGAGRDRQRADRRDRGRLRGFVPSRLDRRSPRRHIDRRGRSRPGGPGRAGSTALPRKSAAPETSRLGRDLVAVGRGPVPGFDA